VGLPPPGNFIPLSIAPAPEGRLRLDWGGGGLLQASTNLKQWITLPLPFPPYIENPAQIGRKAVYYRIAP
jgi:hypothetical protein